MNGQPKSNIERSVALVTGATSGIGRAVALKLASEGFYVIVHGRDMARGSATVEEIESNGGHGRFVSANLSIPSDIERLAAEVGDVDVLVTTPVSRGSDRRSIWTPRRSTRCSRATCGPRTSW